MEFDLHGSPVKIEFDAKLEDESEANSEPKIEAGSEKSSDESAKDNV